MESLGDKELDEAHCLWALCSHPCCWETEHRIAKGIYRRAGRTPAKHCNPVEESFPSLTVVNVSAWAGRRRLPEGKLLHKAVSSDSSGSEGSLLSISCPPVLSHKWKTQRFKSADPAFISASPTLQPAAAKGKVKLNTAQISPDLLGSETPPASLVLWVANPHYTPQGLTQKRSNSPCCEVKELTCLPACPVQKASKEKEKLKGVKKRVSFQLACSPLNEARLTPPGQPDSASDSSPRAEQQRYDIKTPGSGHPSATMEIGVSAEAEDPREKSPLMLRNRPVVLHTMQERGVKRTGEERIDWDRLRRQAYLWRRHNPPQHKDYSVSAHPPEGANVLLEGSGLCPVSQTRPHHPLSSPLSVAPAVWHCVKSSHPPLSQSKDLHHSTASEADTLSSDYSTSTAVDHSAYIQMPDTVDDQSGREKDDEVTSAPVNSLLSCQGPRDSVSERSAVQVRHSFPEESNHSSDSSLSFITGAEEPWRENCATDKGPEPKGYQLSTPPPSRNSL
ncbi:uncharacterized protein [Salminus brasiliensis]|uniref:uncharacterized protein isoform X2 n=1 Tax=Salminus brasiliensis TaxID=930266 RepID=UPI003B831A69